MNEVVKAGSEMQEELSVDERNLLSVAYKNVIGARRAAWRIVSSLEQKENDSGSSAKLPTIKEYKKKVEDELEKICVKILEILNKDLIPNSNSDESKVFFHKM